MKGKGPLVKKKVKMHSNKTKFTTPIMKGTGVPKMVPIGHFETQFLSAQLIDSTVSAACYL